MFEVETRNVEGTPTAIGSADTFTLVVDRPIDGGVRGLGFNGGQTALPRRCRLVSNGLFREARAAGITLTNVRGRVLGDFSGAPRSPKRSSMRSSSKAMRRVFRYNVTRVIEP